MTYDPFDWEYQYGRDDIDYETWYSKHSKELAATYTVAELRAKLGNARDVGEGYSRQWLSRRLRTQSDRVRNMAIDAGIAGQEASDIRSALEIHELFPEHACQRED